MRGDQILSSLRTMMAALPDPPTRKCAVWITPMLTYGDMAIIDTSQLNAWLEIYRGRDPWPEDTLLVMMNAQTHFWLKKLLLDNGLSRFNQFYANDSIMASWLIDAQCDKDGTLNKRLLWRTRQ